MGRELDALWQTVVESGGEVMPDIRELNYADNDFRAQLDEVLAWEETIDGDIVKEVVLDMHTEGSAPALSA